MASLLKSVLKTRAPLHIPPNALALSRSIFLRTLTSSSPQITSPTAQSNNNKKSLSVLFEEAVGLSPERENNGSRIENNELKQMLIELEREVRELKKTNSLKGKDNVKTKKLTESKQADKPENPKTLYTLFSGKQGEKSKDMRREEEEITVFKELSPEMLLFVRVLYRDGYFKGANFLPGSKFDSACFENSYGRDYIKFAAEKFGKDHQEIAKWLSGSELKNVALFGCPSVGRKTVFAAKRLRKFFEIQEDTVCSKCKLRESCKYVNQNIWKGDTKNLNLAVVLRVITLYALESVPQKLSVPDEIKISVSKLLQEVISLSQTKSGS